MKTRERLCAMTGIVALTAAAVCLADATYDDEAVSRAFIRAKGFFCGHNDAVGSEMRWILDTCCGGDTNRYVRIAKETAMTNESFAVMAMSVVEDHGGMDDLPFLYSYTNDVRFSHDALDSVLKVEGVTSNSIAAVRAYLERPDVEDSDGSDRCNRQDIALALLRRAKRGDVGAPEKAAARDVVIDYSLRRFGVIHLDAMLAGFDPQYKFSKRRLHVLRTDLARGLEPYPILYNYTTNAIHELVSYPESELPD